jgi:hypothetical protein
MSWIHHLCLGLPIFITNNNECTSGTLGLLVKTDYNFVLQESLLLTLHIKLLVFRYQIERRNNKLICNIYILYRVTSIFLLQREDQFVKSNSGLISYSRSPIFEGLVSVLTRCFWLKITLAGEFSQCSHSVLLWM